VSRERAGRALELGAIAIVAAAYFYGAIGGGIGLTDEGQIVYPSWEVAHGAIPYVDFRHLYGPSVFFLNGALFRLFGADLAVVRLALVVVKTIVAVLVYTLARGAASRGSALLAVGLLVAIWSAPIWFFNAPYATYYATALSLAGVVIASGPATGLRTFATGVCFGLAATFKQTQGLFAFLAFVLFVIIVTRPGPRPTACPMTRAASGVLRCLALLAVPVLAFAYVRDHIATATACAIILPMSASAAVLLGREIVAWPPSDAAVGGVRLLVLATVGLALPVVAYVAFYLHIGALDALVHDTVSGLPQQISWFAPFRVPGPQTVCFAATVTSVFVVLAGWRERRAGRGSGIFVAGCVALAGSGVPLVRLARATPGLRPYLVGAGWTTDLLALLPWAAFAVLAAGAVTLRARRAEASSASGSHLAALLFLFAAGTTMQLYPAADLPHGTMILAGIAPLLAVVLDALFRVRIPGGRVIVALLLVGTAWPFVRFRMARETAGPPPFARASGVAATDERSREAAALVRHLGEAGVRNGGLLVLTDEQLLYFLAGVGSALPREEFTLYLVGAGLVTDEAARALIDQGASVARLVRVRPLVVDHEGSVESARFRRALPYLAEFIDRRYGPGAIVDGYRVLVPRDPDGTLQDQIDRAR
jgi:hypothetical protein